MAELQNQTINVSKNYPDESYLVNFKNYYIYADMIRNRETRMKVYVPRDISVSNILDHIDGINAILKDGIDEEYVHNIMITVSWGENIECDLFIVDYWFSLFMWAMVLRNGDPILPKHIFFQEELRKADIKKFVDKYVLTKAQKIDKGNEFLNNNVCDGLWSWHLIEEFSMYLANTINNEDFIDLMKKVPEFNSMMHADLSNTPFDQIKSVGMDYTNQIIDIIKNSEQYLGYEAGLANSFRAKEAVNDRQFKEVAVNIGTKSNGSGTVYPVNINRSFMMGGVSTPTYYFVESSTARAAQIMSKTNVGDSGDFARLLGLNNTDTILNMDHTYECNTKNYIYFNIKTKDHLNMIKNRYYKNKINGVTHLIDTDDESLIGRSVYLRSPMTCASHAHGRGICRCCYGDLYYTNVNINVGKYAAEELSAQLTQRLLSAKHLLETLIAQIKWNAEFPDWFDIDINTIKLSQEIQDNENFKKFRMLIDPDDICLVNEEEDAVTMIDEDGNEVQIDDADAAIYNEYITHFYIECPHGVIIRFGSEDQDSMYISQELNSAIRRRATPTADSQISIPLSSIADCPLFFIKLNNNEISKTMNDIINVLNKSAITEDMSKDEALQNIVDLVVDGHLNIDSVHLEVILSNQIVSTKDILRKPYWENPTEKYRLFTLDHALTNNPSVIVSLLYKDLHRVLYNPLTFTKHAPSFFDLFFAVQPQNYMDDKLYTKETDIKDPEKGIEMCKIVDKNNN